ncbi:hypothetical protein Nepgr_028778 [Nepenthes gracilis]|uniref:Uncharacterized protein n=1 Tax=Nepenthes gracilis TaxID=150966 RepID=A0AAD3TCB4_NEPGR|nr:hypothetical protein Nepgr_028778 [Nepenthes gracilis]
MTGGAPARFLAGWRILSQDDSHCLNAEFSDQFAVSLSDTIFCFLEQSHESTKSTTTSDCSDGCQDDGLLDDEEGGNRSNSVEESKIFWENHHKLLREIMRKSSSLEKKIRNATKEAMKEAKEEGNFCDCARPVGGTCRSCLMREISVRLRNAGYDSAVCNSKWRSSPSMPSGKHTFLDVVDNSSSKRGEIRVIIELNFRTEFEIGRASEEYNQLINRLPTAFVGKAERLRELIKILCSAAKRCMKDNKMHMGPWRKHEYMLAKWFGSCQRVKHGNPSLVQELSKKPIKHRASNSLLTIALLDGMPNGHYKVAEVV